MTQEEKIQRLTQALGVTPQAAAAALERTGGDVLEAALLLERERPSEDRRVGYYATDGNPPPAGDPPVGPRPGAAVGGGSRVWAIISQILRGLFTHPVLNYLEVRWEDRVVAEVPVGVLAALFLVAFWITACTVGLGFLLGCRFIFRGPQLDIPEVNWGLDWLSGQIARLKDQAWRSAKK